MTQLYFAYGANLNLENMRHRCPAARPIKAIKVQDWRLTFCDHATIEPCAGAVLEGALWEITPECEQSLDRFEGYPYYYGKRYFTLGKDTVMVYVMHPAAPSPPTQHYVETLEQGYRDWGLDLDRLRQAVQQNVGFTCNYENTR